MDASSLTDASRTTALRANLALGRTVVLTAAAYYLTGRIGLAMAIPPGYATVIWPPAGFALAAILLNGRRAALGVLLGSFLVNLPGHIEGATLAELARSALIASALAAGIAAGAALQAIVGARLALRLGAYPASAASAGSIAKLYAAGGLLGCSVGCTVGVCLLTATGKIPLALAPHSWLVWWSGDVVGVIAITPVVLTFALAPAGQKWFRAAQPAAACLIAFSLTAALVFADLRAIDRSQRADFAALSREAAAQVAATVDLGRHAVEGLAGAFSTDQRPTLVEFRALAYRLAAFGLGIQALEWIPRVAEGDRVAFEADLAGQWEKPFAIFERGSDGKPQPVAPRPDYFPVAYATPFKGNEGAVGFDLASNPARQAALKKAEATGEAVATAGVKLVQTSTMGILLFVPVYESAQPTSRGLDRGTLKGFALGVFSVPDLVGVSMRSEFSQNLKFWLVDETDAKMTPLAASDLGPSAPADLTGDGLLGGKATLGVTERIKVADRTWALHLAPSEAYLVRRSDNSPYYLLLGGLVLMALASGYFLIVSERQHQLVDSREQDLRNQKFALDQHAIVSITDTNGIITYANGLFCAVSGYPRELLIGASHNIVNSGEHSQEFYQEFWATLKSGEVWRGEICNRNRDGELYWLAATLVPLKDKDGRLKEFVAICTDVTARKRLEQDLEQSRAFLQSVTDSMGEGVYTLDAQGRCTFLNAEGERLLGWSFAELKGRSLHDLVHYQTLDGELIPDVACAIINGLRPNGTYHSEDQYFTHRSGKLFPVSIVAKRIVRNGEGLGAVIVFQDITERRRVHDRMRLSEERLSVALSAASTGLWDFNPITGQAYYSDTWFRMLGYEPKPNPCDGGVFFSLLHPDDREAYDLALERHLAEGDDAVECEFRMRRADGEWAWIRSTGKLIDVDDDGKPLRIVGVHVDTTASHAARTELANATDAAIRANQAKGDFLATMSHEIRTPMNAIIGLAHLLARTDLSARQRDFLLKIQDASQALLAIINDILDFSKIEAGKLNIETVEFNLDEVVKSTMALVAPKLNEKGIRLEIIRAPEIPSEFVGDPLRISQVLMNLLSNAAKFTARGEVRLELSGRLIDDGRCQLSVAVSDTGIGMSEAQMTKLFTPFTQADASTSRRFGGTGLGLAICRQILHLMSGDIAVASQEGQGTTFTFELSLKLAPPPSLATQDAEALAGKRALIVDDSRSMRRMLRSALAGFGLLVEEAENSAEALKQLESGGSFDLVTLDWKLPGESGVETLTAMRERGIAAPVLLITAYGKAEVEQDIGAHFPAAPPPQVHVVEKPVSARGLREHVLAAFGRGALGNVSPGPEARTASDILLRDVRVLLVEDNPINQQVATGLLETLGVETTVADSGEEALEILATRQFDAILMDMQMPGMDGLQTTVAIRTELGLTETPIIAMTANAMAGDRERCLESGMNDHIPKPIDPDKLALTLAHWLETTGVEVSRRVEPILKAPAREHSAAGDAAIFDREAALYHLGGSEELLMELLAMFAEEHADDAQAIAAAFDAEDRRRVCALSHSLKGAAATLGAKRVAELALAIETATRPDAEATALAALRPKLSALSLALPEAIAAMSALHSGEAETRSEVETVAPPARAAALVAIDALSRLLLSGDADAEPESERLVGMFRGAAPDARTLAADIRTAAEHYDFDDAQARLGRLREEVRTWN